MNIEKNSIVSGAAILIAIVSIIGFWKLFTNEMGKNKVEFEKQITLVEERLVKNITDEREKAIEISIRLLEENRAQLLAADSKGYLAMLRLLDARKAVLNSKLLTVREDRDAIDIIRQELESLHEIRDQVQRLYDGDMEL